MARKTFLSILALLVTFPISAGAYDDTTTHPALTQEIISFYNLLHPDRAIIQEQAEWIIAGSRDEDVVPRWMNHFYDPVRGEGWTGEHAGTLASSTVRELAKIGVSSQDPIAATEWINNRAAQAALSRYGGDWTWEQGLEAYAKDDLESAHIALGHALHLLEDMTVPDHTRNDTHASIGIIGDDGSPYEDYARRWTRESIRKLNVPNNLTGNGSVPIRHTSINEYLNAVAQYSNNTFFSKDTINDPKYELPQFFKKTGSIFGYDEYRREIELARVISVKEGGLNITTKFVLKNTNEYEEILDSYFSRLSKVAVLNGAGVIELFFQEAEDYKLNAEFPSNLVRFDFSFLETPTFSFIGELERARGSVASLWANVASLFSKADDVDEEDEELAIESEYEDSDLNEADENYAEDEEGSENFGEVVFRLIGAHPSSIPVSISPTASSATTSVSSSIIAPVTSSSATSNAASLDPNANVSIAITEIMYDASGSDSGREWIEIWNSGDGTVYPEELKLVEGGSSHKLTFNRGSRELWGNGYAVIAANANGFLEDHPSFAGSLFISSFSLNNTSEEIGFANKTKVLSSVTYDSEWGGHGDGNSLQRDGSLWRSGVPTPGGIYLYIAPTSTTPIVPVVVYPTSTPLTETAPAAKGVVISEIQVQGEDGGDEFIELYNPTGSAVDLSEYSIQYVSGSSEVTEDTVAKKNFPAGSSIPSSGFFLIARELNESGTDGYRGASDFAHRAFSLSAASNGGKVFLVQNQDTITRTSDANIADWVNYAGKIPPVGSSIERRARGVSSCISPLPGEAGEFQGHACDSGVIGDFETRSVSFPQGSANLREPRARPAKPVARPDAEGIGTYLPDLVAVDLLWSPALDAEGGAAGGYEVRQTAGAASFATTTSALRYRYRTMEVGRTLAFEVRSIDRDGFPSDPAEISIDVPGFLETAQLYLNPTNDDQYVIDLHYPSREFIPPVFSGSISSPPMWQGIAAYLNHVADIGAAHIESVQNGIMFAASLCNGYQTPYSSVIFTTTRGNCGTGGVWHARSMFLPEEDNLLRVPLAIEADTLDLWPDAYVTVAYYDYAKRSTNESGPSLVAVDARKFPLLANPVFKAPVLGGNLVPVFDRAAGTLKLSWSRATDPDSPDDGLSYELYEAGLGDLPASDGWISVGSGTSTVRTVYPNDRQTYYLRAKDEMGKTSEPISVSWEYPAVTALVDQWMTGSWSVGLGTALKSSYSDPQRGSFQSITLPHGGTADAVFVKMKRDGTSYGNAMVRLSVYGITTGGGPDFSARLAEASAPLGPTSAEGIDVKFTFASPFSFAPGLRYWLVLDVTAYASNSNGFFSNVEYNALSDGDTYPDGEARSGWAQGAQPNCNQCSIDGPSISPSDWYMKIVDE